MLPHYPHMGVDDEKHLKRHIETFYVELLGSTLYLFPRTHIFRLTADSELPLGYECKSE